MTISNLPIAGSVPALIGSQRQADGDADSQQGWLRELERAQAQLLTKHPVQHSQSQHSIVEKSLPEPLAVAQRLAAHAPLPQSVMHSQKLAEPSQAAQILPQQTVSATQALMATVIRTSSSQTASTPLLVMPEQESASPATLNALGAGGREAMQYAAASMRLLKSTQQAAQEGATSEAVIDLVVRDAGMSLQEELNLTATVRETLKKTGARLGAIWLNGQLINNPGENHGN